MIIQNSEGVALVGLSSKTSLRVRYSETDQMSIVYHAKKVIISDWYQTVYTF